MGQRVFTLDYDGSDLKTWRAPFAPDAIDPQRIVADLQFAYWPLPALKSAWQIGETQVIEPRPGLRRLIHGDRIVAEVHSATADRFPARLWLVNFVYGYSLDIEIGRASCRARVCQYVSIWVVPGSLKKK